MDTDRTPPPEAQPPAGQPAAPGPAKAAAKADRLAREAAALRRNLHKRKDQARQRVEPVGTPRTGAEET